MPIRVQFIGDARADLRSYARSRNIRLFLQKLVRLEEIGKDAGRAIGGNLAGYYKIVVGDRNWRIIFTLNPDETVATVIVIGDRADSACYDLAQRRLAAVNPQTAEVASLAATMLELPQLQKKPRR